uniref:Adenylate cyclase N-terminal domain-containing protein n=1 Tax=Ascaris lumbricoides TaxID=6252 RepID=A0A9J2Q4E6_ASCLU
MSVVPLCSLRLHIVDNQGAHFKVLTWVYAKVWKRHKLCLLSDKRMRTDEGNAEEAMRMLADERDHARTPVANGSSGHHTIADMAHGRSMSPRRIPLFERASARWWNPQFASSTLESQYWKCSFPQLRDRFRSGLIYVCLTCILWIIYLQIFDHADLVHWVMLTAFGLVALSIGMLLFTLFSVHYQRFYMPTSFLCVFVLCTITLLVFSDSSGSFMSPVGELATSFQLTAFGLVALSIGMLLFTLFSVHYQRFYMPTSFLCVFVLCTITLLVFSDSSGSFMSPVGELATSFQVSKYSNAIFIFIIMLNSFSIFILNSIRSKFRFYFLWQIICIFIFTSLLT